MSLTLSQDEIQAGSVFAVAFPFIRTTYDEMDEGGVTEAQTWRPGCDYRPCAPDDTEGYCHAEGQMELTVVDVHKPAKYPARVFFVRQWISPEGKRFGKTKLHIMTVPAFKRRAKGWFADPYVIDPEGFQ